MSLRKLLVEEVAAYGVALDESQVDRFFLFMEELLKWNRKVNLTAITDRREIVVKHFLDSLTLAPLIPAGATVLDLGSGGGFPVIPLAIVRPDIRAVSVDAVEKKIFFQRQACRAAKVENVEAVHMRGEELGEKYPEYFDVAVSRAFSEIPSFVKLAGPAVRPGGIVIAMKGARGREEAAEAADHLPEGYRLVEEREFRLPDDAGSRIVLIYTK